MSLLFNQTYLMEKLLPPLSLSLSKYLYIYIYIERERERGDRQTDKQ